MHNPPDDDRDLQDRLRRVLTACAATGETLAYRDLAQRAALPGPHSIHRLTLALEAMIRADHAADRPLLAALAVGRAQRGPDGRALPGRGFFHLLAELGRYDGPDNGPAAAACHAGEVARAQAYWGRSESSGCAEGDGV